MRVVSIIVDGVHASQKNLDRDPALECDERCHTCAHLAID